MPARTHEKAAIPIPRPVAASRRRSRHRREVVLSHRLGCGMVAEGPIDEGVLYLIVLLVGGLIVGFAFRWWGLIAPVGFACFLAYAWEFYSPALAYAVIAGLISACGVVAGSLLRRRHR